jgi:hypothetical protein
MPCPYGKSQTRTPLKLKRAAPSRKSLPYPPEVMLGYTSKPAVNLC